MREAASLTRRAAAALPLAALLRPAAAAVPALVASGSPDPVLDQIERHRALRVTLNRMSGRDDDPAYLRACDVEEAALQALGDAVPETVAGAAALLAYMAEVEGDFADPGSPLLRTVLAVASGLSEMGRPKGADTVRTLASVGGLGIADPIASRARGRQS